MGIITKKTEKSGYNPKTNEIKGRIEFEAIIRASVRYKDIEKIEEALETIFKDIKRKENCE